MKGTRALSFLLALVMLASLVIPGSLALPAKADDTDNGMCISKTAKDNGDGTYTITLEAYATGSKIISEVKTDIPTDIVLVLDRSGSMSDPIKTTEQFTVYEDVTILFATVHRTRNQDYYEYRHNGGIYNLWHKVGNSYFSVSVTRQENASYKELDTELPNYVSGRWNSISENCYYYYANNLYEKVGEESYQKVELKEKQDGDWRDPTYTYTYTFVDGTSVSSTGRDSKPELGSHAPLYYKTVDDTQTKYTYTYTDASGNVQTIGESIGATNKPKLTFYERTLVSDTNGDSRLDALKTAAGGFVTAVAEKAKGTDKTDPSDDVKHRLAVVSYASDSTKHTNGLLDMTVAGNVSTAKNAINGLNANGGTMIDSGINTANGIFADNPITSSDTNGRQRVLIVFTDGAPGSSGDWQEDSRNTANNAINYANEAKNTYGATVYTIGVFPGADASSPAFLPTYTDSGYILNARQVANSNRFMHLLSSNYPQATSMKATGALNSKLNGNSYYLSAADAGTLSSIFQQIASNIESGGSSTTLDANAVIRDIIAPQFELPDNATAENIKLYTAESNGSVNSWKTRETFDGSVSLGPNDNSVSVSGFSFKDNWCGKETNNGQETFHDGKKLIIEFTVQPKAGFLGGNGVYTNTSAGVYENDKAQKPVFTFERPQVNVPIKDVTVTAADKNVYLLGDLTAAQLKDGATVTVGDTVGGVSLDLNEENYGLADWQTEYVDIGVVIKDKNDTDISATGLTGLTDDNSYTVSVTVSPKGTTDGAKSGTGTGNIYVYKPVLTYKDSSVYYGDDVPTNFTANLVSTQWKHGDTLDTAVTMDGTAPKLTTTNTPDSTKIVDNKINTKQDVPVNVTVDIDGTDVTTHTTFPHQDCVTGEDLKGGKFLLHVNTCQLTIIKSGGDSSEPYVFTVLKDGEKYTEVTVMGNNSKTIYELPFGTYSIQEDTRWSWRYTPEYSNAVALSKDVTSGTITCSNTQAKSFWLNGFSNVMQNIFNKAG